MVVVAVGRRLVHFAVLFLAVAHIHGAPTPQAICHIDIANADDGTIRPSSPPDHRHHRCTWSVSAPPAHKLLVSVDSARLGQRSVLSLIVDDGAPQNFTGQCHTCLERHLVGESVFITYDHQSTVSKTLATHHPLAADDDINGSFARVASPHFPLTLLPDSDPETDRSSDDFVVSYRAFDPTRCPPPTTSEEGRVIGRERVLGSRISYRCNPPYVAVPVAGKQVTTEALCRMTPGSPVPAWSAGPPACSVPECGKNPVALSVGVGEAEGAVLLVHPGYPGGWRTSKTAECVWEVSTGRKKHLLVTVERADLPPHTTLALYDGKISERRRLDTATARVVSGGNFATVAGKLVVVLRSGTTNEATGDDDHEVSGWTGERPGFRLRVTARKPPCGMPTPPVHGDVRGSELVQVAQSSAATAAAAVDSVRQMMVFYSCDTGFQLTGASSSVSCSGAGEFTSTAPLCVALPLRIPPPPPPQDEVSVATPMMDADAGVDNASDAIDLPAKSANPRIFNKDRRPHPQSTQEKTNVKTGKDEEMSGAKQPIHGPADPSGVDRSVLATEGSEPNGANSPPIVDDYGNPPLEEAEAEEEQQQQPAEEEGEMVDTFLADGEEEEESPPFPVLAVALGVALPLLLITLAVVGGIAYRRLYPVRMNMGRKFDTFENPVYNRSKRDPNTTGTLLPGGNLETPPRPPAELQRLMTNRR